MATMPTANGEGHRSATVRLSGAAASNISQLSDAGPVERHPSPTSLSKLQPLCRSCALLLPTLQYLRQGQRPDLPPVPSEDAGQAHLLLRLRLPAGAQGQGLGRAAAWDCCLLPAVPRVAALYSQPTGLTHHLACPCSRPAACFLPCAGRSVRRLPVHAVRHASKPLLTLARSRNVGCGTPSMPHMLAARTPWLLTVTPNSVHHWLHQVWRERERGERQPRLALPALPRHL